MITQILEFLEGPLDLTPLDTELSLRAWLTWVLLKLFLLGCEDKMR